MPEQTPYDTGARYEPQLWSPTSDDDYGRVDFDNDESATVLTVYAEPDQDGTQLVIDPTGTDAPVTVVHQGHAADGSGEQVARLGVPIHEVLVSEIAGIVADPARGVVSLVGLQGGRSRIIGEIYYSYVIDNTIAFETEHGVVHLEPDQTQLIAED